MILVVHRDQRVTQDQEGNKDLKAQEELLERGDHRVPEDRQVAPVQKGKKAIQDHRVRKVKREQQAQLVRGERRDRKGRKETPVPEVSVEKPGRWGRRGRRGQRVIKAREGRRGQRVRQGSLPAWMILPTRRRLFVSLGWQELTGVISKQEKGSGRQKSSSTG
ncbi:hypothetical protein BvCmsKKP020_03979 [Escherichia coli]|nr:hypothetical protein BvCmsKKP020_03979 [Escherichia coli]